MTAYIVFECNNCGLTTRTETVSVVTAYHKLKQRGWSAELVMNEHYCPKCTKEREDAKPNGVDK